MAILLRFGAYCQPYGIDDEGVPLFFAIGKTVPLQDVIQIVVTVTNQGRPESDRANFELVLSQLQCVIFKTGIQVGQSAGERVVNA